VNIDQIETLYQAEAKALETLKQGTQRSVEGHVKAAGALSRALRNNWPALRDELRRQQVAIEKAREALSYLPYESALRLRERIREGLAALDEPASDAGDKVRFCPECFGVGEVAGGHYACCPEMRSFYIPKVAADAIKQMKPAYFRAIKASNAEAALGEPASGVGGCRKCGDKLNHDDDGPDICRFCESEVQSGQSAKCAAPKGGE
jgi:hypothetical protein